MAGWLDSLAVASWLASEHESDSELGAAAGRWVCGLEAVHMVCGPWQVHWQQQFMFVGTAGDSASTDAPESWLKKRVLVGQFRDQSRLPNNISKGPSDRAFKEAETNINNQKNCNNRIKLNNLNN